MTAVVGDSTILLCREIKNLTNQEQRYLKAYALGEVDDGWIKAQSGPVKMRREHAEKALEKLQAQRSSSHTLKDMRESLEEICERVRERFASMDYEEKRLGLEALNVSATLTDHHVEVNVVLGVGAQDSRLITTAQTSA